jgi:hypothetical protein
MSRSVALPLIVVFALMATFRAMFSGELREAGDAARRRAFRHTLIVMVVIAIVLFWFSRRAS